MEHFYQDIPGYFTFEAFYAAMAKSMPANPHCVEVGVAHGRSAAFLAVELMKRGDHPRLDLVDLFTMEGPDTLSNVCRRLQPATKVLGVCICAPSWEAAARYSDCSLDMVYVDADHTYESLRKDIAAWWPKVKPWGVLAGHDFCGEYPGVVDAVCEAFDEFQVDRGERFKNGKFYPTWWVRK